MKNQIEEQDQHNMTVKFVAVLIASAATSAAMIYGLERLSRRRQTRPRDQRDPLDRDRDSTL